MNRREVEKCGYADWPGAGEGSAEKTGGFPSAWANMGTGSRSSLAFWGWREKNAKKRILYQSRAES
jgi:hypothetical protein